MSSYNLRRESDTHFIVLKDGIQFYNMRFKGKAWSCDCPARKTCKHLAMLPPEVQVKRYPRADIEAAYKKIEDYLFPYRHTIVGSYRRGAPESKDLDIIVLCDATTFNELRMQLSDYVLVTSGGDQKFTGIIDGIPIDIDRIDSPDHYAAALLYRTGPASLNIKMRQIAKEQGWTLNEKIPAKSEEEIFRRLGMDYISPEDRV